MADPIDADALATALAELSDWSGDGAGISATFTFDDFRAAIDWMAGLAPTIDEANHHPEWTNVYNKVMVTLKTHDADDRVTQKDLDLAKTLSDHYPR